MTRVLVRSIGVSLDGFSAGPDQDLEHPLGVGGEAVFQWFFHTQTFKTIHGGDGGVVDIDDKFAQAGFENIGAWIIGRNMFGPVRGGWGDESWQGWWGDEPPYHVPVFVLTHHARKDLPMLGDTRSQTEESTKRWRGQKKPPAQGRSHRRWCLHDPPIPGSEAD